MLPQFRFGIEHNSLERIAVTVLCKRLKVVARNGYKIEISSSTA